MTPLLTSLLAIPLVSGWSEEGHAIITNVAARLVSEQASRYLESHIVEDLVAASVWADSEGASARYPESHEYHFSHTPYQDCKPFDIARDCGFPGKEGLCIVTGLADAIQMATDPYASRDSRVDSIKFVLHFMGDIHQPLHTGFREDFGGNAIRIANMPDKTLHELWDFDLVRRRIGTSGIQSFTDAILKSVRSNSGAFIKRLKDQVDVLSILQDGVTEALVGYTADLASDTSTTSTCKMAYMKNPSSYIENGDFITDEYLDQRAVSVQVQLSKAAVRLSVLLDAMAEVYASRRAAKKGVAREGRIHRLFEERQKAAASKVSNPFEGNQYAVLAMEFDPIKLQWVMPSDEVAGGEEADAAAESSSGRKLPSGIRRKKNQQAEEDSVLAEFIEARERTTFQGVDLSTIILLVRNGLNIITCIHHASRKGYTPTSVFFFRVKFSGNAVGHDTIVFYFDLDVFRTGVSSELAVRSIMKIHGMATATDLSTLETSVPPSPESGAFSVERITQDFPLANGKREMAGGELSYGGNPEQLTAQQAEAAEVFDRRSLAYLREQSRKRLEAIDEEFKAFKLRNRTSKKPVTIEDFWVAKIGKIRQGIVSLSEGRVTMYALASTLTNPANANRIRFNRMDIFDSSKDAKPEEYILTLIDPNICDCLLTPAIYNAILRAMDRGPKVPKRSILGARQNLPQELQDIGSAFIGTDPSRLEKLKAIKFMRDYYSGPIDGWNNWEYRIVEWATKAADDSIFDPPASFKF